MAYVLTVNNVNEALSNVMRLVIKEKFRWRTVSPRGKETLEWKEQFITTYKKPWERVLFNEVRDANPFFHFFESLWILAGRNDVEFLAQFNSNIASYSDDGVSFYGAYGHRLREWFLKDQLVEAIEILRTDHDTRQVVLSLWDPYQDLNAKTKDLPCNDMIFLKIRDNALQMTVCCRSNDVIWGAYGANAVQFSMLQEFIARAVGVKIGYYTQVSDSFHIYTDNEAFKRLLKEPFVGDLYWTTSMQNGVHPLMADKNHYKDWLDTVENFVDNPPWLESAGDVDPFFSDVVLPIYTAWTFYKVKMYDSALSILSNECRAYDWATACDQWIRRRMK